MGLGQNLAKDVVNVSVFVEEYRALVPGLENSRELVDCGQREECERLAGADLGLAGAVGRRARSRLHASEPAGGSERLASDDTRRRSRRRLARSSVASRRPGGVCCVDFAARTIGVQRHDADAGAGADAEDVAQDTFVSAYKALPRFQFESKFSTWLYRIAVNKCTDVLRARRPGHVSLDSTDGEDVAAWRPSMTTRRTRSWSESSWRPSSSKGIQALPPLYRESFVLKHVEGLAYDEMSEILGVPRDTLKMRVYKARTLLCRSLAHLAGVQVMKTRPELVQRFVDQELSAEERIQFIVALGRDQALRERVLALERLVLDAAEAAAAGRSRRICGTGAWRGRRHAAASAAPVGVRLQPDQRLASPDRRTVGAPGAAVESGRRRGGCLSRAARGWRRSSYRHCAGRGVRGRHHRGAQRRRTPPVVLVRLVVVQPGARVVQAAGDFNGWNPSRTPLEQTADGAWTVTLPLEPGRYEYQFVVDGDQLDRRSVRRRAERRRVWIAKRGARREAGRGVAVRVACASRRSHVA